MIKGGINIKVVDKLLDRLADKVVERMGKNKVMIDGEKLTSANLDLNYLDQVDCVGIGLKEDKLSKDSNHKVNKYLKDIMIK